MLDRYRVGLLKLSGSRITYDYFILRCKVTIERIRCCSIASFLALFSVLPRFTILSC